MNVEVVPLTSFIHGSINAHEGRPLTMDASAAGDLERAGLIRIKLAQTHASADIVGKAADDGAGQPSSALPAAQALPTTTSHLSKDGAGRRGRKIGT